MPMDYDEVAQKFLENCEFAQFDLGKARQVIDLVRRIEELRHIGELTALLGH